MHMNRYFHLQILVSMLCLAAAARRHQRVRTFVEIPRQPDVIIHHTWHARQMNKPAFSHGKREPSYSRKLPEDSWTSITPPPMSRPSRHNIDNIDQWRGIPSARTVRLAPSLRPVPWNGGIAEPTSVQHARQYIDPSTVKYEESLLNEDKPMQHSHNKGHLFSWNSEDPSFYETKVPSENKKKSKKQLSTPWKYFQERPAFYTSPVSRESRESNESKHKENES